MKKYFFRILTVISSLLLLVVISILLLIFFRPGTLINTTSLKFALERSSILKSWSWNTGEMNFGWHAWNDRSFHGQFNKFCFEYTSLSIGASSCIEEISWNLKIKWTMQNGLHVETIDPFFLRSDLLSIVTRDTQVQEKKKSPPPVWDSWNRLWAKWFPDLDINFKEVRVVSENKKHNLDLRILKKPKSLLIETLDFKLLADPEKFAITGPEVYTLPSKIKLKRPLEIRSAKLTGHMKKEGIPLDFSASLEGAEIHFDSYINLPIAKSFSSLAFRKGLILNTHGRIKILDIKKLVRTYAQEPYDELPAPLNVMNGDIEFRLESEKTGQKEMLLLKTATSFNLEGKKQVINFAVSADVPVNVMDFSRGLTQVGIHFKEVSLQLPRLSKKEPPPQFFPDKRFKSEKTKRKITVKKKGDISLDLEAMNEKALHIRSNLLDEPLRLNFDLDIRNGDVKDGFLKVLPLKTTVFKRPVRIRDLVIEFHAPQEPVIESTIQFPLPEYKISLNLEGPFSKPRYAFSSKPPLPQNDIYAVLLFGRPLSELNTEDKNAARQTNKLLAQGILSLSVLYFLAGSPVEYIGYDPETGRATAQFGIDQKTSLNVGAGEGSRSTGVRRSLGKGWYLDTSVQSTSDPANEGANDYGVLLERIIAY